MSKNDDALRCANTHEADPKRKQDWERNARVHIRRLVAENEAQAKQINAYKLLEQSQTEQLSHHRAQADKYREAIDTLQSERDANARLTAENEVQAALLRQAVEALVLNCAGHTHGKAKAAIAAIRQHLEGKA